MNLIELCRDYLVYLVEFREKASTPAAPSLQQARAEILALLDRMEVQTRREPSLALPFQKVRYALVALADEILCNFGWERALEWRNLTLERQIFQTSQAGYHFFELIDQIDPKDQEVSAVYYLCLALGFSGDFEPDHPELAEYKRKLLARLPEGSRPELPGEPPRGSPSHPKAKPQSKPARVAILGGLAALVIAGLVGAGWYFGPDNFLPRSGQVEKKASPPPQDVAGAAKAAKAAKSAETAKASPAAKPAAAKATRPPAAEPEKPKQLVLVPGRTTTAQKPLPPPPKPQPKAPAPKPLAEKPKPQPTTAQKAVPPKTAPPKTAVKPAEKPKQTVKPRPEKKSPTPVKKAPKAVKPATGSYQLFVASFVGPKQSGRLAKKLKAMGYPVKVELLHRPGKKPWYVVKVAPVKDKKTAKRIAVKVYGRFKVRPMVRPIE